MDEEKIIKTVRKYPCIWEVSNKSYRDAKARENAWKQVVLSKKHFWKSDSC